MLLPATIEPGMGGVLFYEVADSSIWFARSLHDVFEAQSHHEEVEFQSGSPHSAVALVGGSHDQAVHEQIRVLEQSFPEPAWD